MLILLKELDKISKKTRTKRANIFAMKDRNLPHLKLRSKNSQEHVECKVNLQKKAISCI